MKLARSILRSLLFLALLVAAWLDGHIRKLCFGMRPGPGGAVWIHRWCRRIVRALGIACTVEGPTPHVRDRNLAVISNHLSYLDILIYSAATPFIMVAKSEIRSWPLLGWITAQAGTVYVQRSDVQGGRTQTHAEVNTLMAEAFRSGLPVLFFPEGTTTDASQILPFRRGLFHSVLADNVPVQPAALSYTLDQPNQSASVANDVCYWGDMVFGPHLFRCLGLRGLHASIRFDDTRIPGQDRFALALNGHRELTALYTDLLQTTSRHAPADLEDSTGIEHTLAASRS